MTGVQTCALPIYLNTTATGINLITNGPGTCNIKNLYFRRITTASGWPCIIINSTASAANYNVFDCMFDLNSLGDLCVWQRDSVHTISLYNLTAWDNKKANWHFLQDAGVGNVNSNYENITLLNSLGKGFTMNGSIGNMRNRYAEGGGNDFDGIGGMTGENNASSDTTAANANWSTGTNNLTSQPTSEFESVTDTDSTFAKVKSGTLSTAGTATQIAGNIAGSRGNTGGRTGATPSIGSDEFPASAPPDIPDTSSDVIFNNSFNNNFNNAFN